MSNPNFIAMYDTNEVYRDGDVTRCLTDDLNTIEADILALETGKSNSDHTHTGYASIVHEHSGYAAYDHTHVGYAAENHVHDAIVVTEAGKNLDDYVTPGIWSFPQSYAPLNVPAGTNGWLIVLPWGDGDGTVKQVWMRHGTLGETDHEIYTRLRVADRNIWSAWTRVLTTKDKIANIISEDGGESVDFSDLDVTVAIAGLATGMYTGYAPADSDNAPNSSEAWRFLIHKTGVNYGWVMAFGSSGSIYSNYINAGTWHGWMTIVDGMGAPLWKHESNGGYYMIASQTVTPSKTLDQCRNGWILVWSDYDPATNTTNNSDLCTTLIPKRGPTGALWNGLGFLCSVPTYMNEAADTDTIHIKKVYVYNDKLVGFAGNSLGDRRDVVLRAVYEF